MAALHQHPWPHTSGLGRGKEPTWVSEGTQAGVMPGTLQAHPHPLRFPPEHLDGRVPPGVRCPTSPQNKREAPGGF